VAHAAIDAGADAIIGTHPHVLKAIEVYKGKVIFYSLGDFGFDTMLDPATGKPRAASRTPRSNLERIVNAASEDRKKTGIASITISGKTVKKVSFLPVFFHTNEDGAQVAERLLAGSKLFRDVINYQKDVTQEAGIDTKFEIEGDELVIVS
jgi:poly-gamma-glutamate synthesis protein (capsule biosynthesis protein)